MAFAPKRSELERFLGPSALPEWVDAFARLSPGLCEFYGFNRLRWVHFIGQVAHETAGLTLRDMCENMYFTTVDRIIQVYNYRLKLCIDQVNKGKVKEPAFAKGMTVRQLAQRCVRNPTLLADIVYGGREGTPWMQGSRYIGRGPTQVTHRDNYALVWAEIQKQPGGDRCPNLVINPEALCDPEWGWRSGFADWAIMGLNRFADQDNVDLVSDALNTGNVNDNVKPHGLNERRRWVAKAKAVWSEDKIIVPSAPVPAAPREEKPAALVEPKVIMIINGAPITRMLREGSQGDDVKVLQERLKELRYFTGLIDGKFGRLTRRAVVAFQSEHGLDPDGVVGPKTAEALNESAPADLGEREEVTAKELRKRGSRIVTFAERIRNFFKWLCRIFFGTSIAEASGIDVIDQASMAAGRINGLIDQVIGVPSPKMWVVIGLSSAAILAFVISRWSEKIIEARVDDAQTGANLSR